MKQVIWAALLLLATAARGEDKKPFSGPQPGEKLPPLPMKGVFDADAGKDLDVVSKAAGKPTVLVFLHVVDRPTIGFTRALLNYTATRAKDGVHGGLVYLADDSTEAESALKRMRGALPQGVAIGIAAGGKEGPGSYGLNRNVSLTVLIAKDHKVTANFALVQPSMQADLPKVLEELAKVAGGKPPKLEDLPEMKAMPGRPKTDDKLTGMLRALIQKTATEEQVDKKAAEIVAYIKTNEAARKEVGRITTTLVKGGKLSDYGTPRAQEKIKAWAKEYGPPVEKPKP